MFGDITHSNNGPGPLVIRSWSNAFCRGHWIFFHNKWFSEEDTSQEVFLGKVHFEKSSMQWRIFCEIEESSTCPLKLFLVNSSRIPINAISGTQSITSCRSVAPTQEKTYWQGYEIWRVCHKINLLNVFSLVALSMFLFRGKCKQIQAKQWDWAGVVCNCIVSGLLKSSRLYDHRFSDTYMLTSSLGQGYIPSLLAFGTYFERLIRSSDSNRLTVTG